MRSPRKTFVLSFAVSLLVGLAACGSERSGDPVAASTDTGRCVSHYDANTDYFPVKQTLRHATNFTITYAKNYQVITVKQPSPGAKPEKYVLVRCGTPAPRPTGDLAGAVMVEVPVRSLFAASTTHLPFLADLGALDLLKGIPTVRYVTSPEVWQRVRSGSIIEYASGEEIDIEKVIGARPDVLVGDGMEKQAYGPLRDAGIKILENAEWLESTPLGRAEWIKFFAALTGTEAKAAEIFGKVEREYTALAEKAKGVKPATVLLGTMYSGQWYMPAGGSYAATLLKDAGGTYAWAGTEGTGSISLDLETVLAKAGHAPTWLVIENTWRTLADVEQADPRYAKLTAVQDGNVWSANKVLGPGGGNDYYERGVARPDLILADLIAILHPELAPGHEFTFYRRLTK
ncbi:ABC transporter substrate-binding protein [Thermobispora bispora]|uniref:Periplasmic binding protein n=1 Tax=Thermobispora bispora (strain ATCC 19993 / DSM 43833 / CBS 139.67 / JCM 10125 / KCTC 9307 / NBRC 14880 / R51) TaxID=469371 RepID=D6YAD3_THEBD|nr:ABC transporter substrate-binding protein [Thermobispora bispora]ADG90186.1 periplasmic binding protein [Thermobispora bispora DSM 43833]